MATNYFKDNADLQFYFDQWIDWGTLVDKVEHGYRFDDGFSNLDEAKQFYRDIVEMVGDFVAAEIAPRSAKIDQHELELVDGEVVASPEFDAIFDQIKALELHGMCVPRELGGMNVPLVVYMLNAEMMSRADVSVMTHHSFHGGIAMALLIYSLNEGTTEFDPDTRRVLNTRFGDAIREIAAGEAWGSMDITEPDAGSDMAALRAKGEQDADGNWFVTGQKIFITSGHGKYHLVIARTEDSSDPDDPMAGLGGLSFFMVPAYETDADGNKKWLATVDRVEEKLGHHGSATCSISFERTPAFLIGKRGEGFQKMLMLMNNARVGVGFEAVGLCEASLRLARDYAAERTSMGKTIDHHEMIADYLDEMEVDTKAIRAMAMHAAFHEEMSQRVGMERDFASVEGSPEAAELSRQLEHHRWESRRVTPLLKYFGAEKAVEMGRRAVQIHGGVGYTREYGAEQLMRDAMVMPIYEGTSQIQALMAMKDTLGHIIKNPQEFVRKLAQARWRALSSTDALERRVAKLQVHCLSAQQHLMSRTATDKFRAIQGRPISEWPDAFLKNWDPKRDFAFAMLHAERLMRILVDATVAELFLEQVRKYPERAEILEAWLERAEPRTRFQLNEIETTGERILARLGRLPQTARAEAAE